MDAKSAPTGAWKTAKSAVSHNAHNPSEIPSFYPLINRRSPTKGAFGTLEGFRRSG